MTTVGYETFDVGRVITRMIGVFGRNAVTFLLAALVLAALPLAMFGFSSRIWAASILHGTPQFSDIFSLRNVGLGLGGFLLTLLTSLLLQAAVIYATVSDLNGRRAGLGEILRVALGAILPLIFLAILVGLSVMVGFILLIVPGIIVSLVFCVATPVRVVEGGTVLGAMGRSAELTRGHRFMIFLLALLLIAVGWVMGMIVGGVSLVVGLGAGGSNFVQTLANQRTFLTSAPYLITSVTLQSLAGAVQALLGAAGVASLYYELRTVKEGVGAQALAAAFG
jgi:hypothetical protein